jgi:hypothetical protein
VCACAQPEVFKALQRALTAVGVRLSDLGNEQWSLSDGRSLTRFTDGVVRSPLCSSKIIHCSPYAPFRDQAG